METITMESNEYTIKKLNEGIDRSWDTMIYGDKEKGIKPGNIFVYGTIVGQREVKDNRIMLREKLKKEKGEELGEE